MNSIEFNSLENSRNCYVNYRGNTSRVCNIDKVEGLLEILLKDNEKADDFESVWVRYENCEIEPCANFSNTKEFHYLRKTFESYVNSPSCPIYFGCPMGRDSGQKNNYYFNGKLNDAFIMYLSGYMNGRLVYQK